MDTNLINTLNTLNAHTFEPSVMISDEEAAVLRQKAQLLGAALRYAYYHAPSVEFQAKWNNGTGYFDGAVPELFDAPIVKCTDPQGRRMVFVNDGTSSIVIFDRYAPKVDEISTQFAVNYGKLRGPNHKRFLSCAGTSAADFADVESERYKWVIRQIAQMPRAVA